MVKHFIARVVTSSTQSQVLLCVLNRVKTAYTGSPESFREVVRLCPVPVVILGGPKMDSDRELLEVVKGCTDAGGAGTSMGRNVFQHRDPKAVTAAICKIVHEEASVEEALKIIQ